MSDDARKALLAYIGDLSTRSLIVELKGSFSMVSGVFRFSGLGESNIRLRSATSTSATCDLDISLPDLCSFSVTTFREAKNSVLRAAVESLMAEGHSFHADVVEQVGVLRLADGSTCLIGVLKDEIDPSALSPIVN
jgi:hypothetical protein